MGRPTKKLAMLCIDVQNHFREAIGTEPALVQKLNDLAAYLRSRGVPIVYTQHGTPNPAAEEDTNVLVAFWGAAESIKCGSGGICQRRCAVSLHFCWCIDALGWTFAEF